MSREQTVHVNLYSLPRRGSTSFSFPPLQNGHLSLFSSSTSRFSASVWFNRSTPISCRKTSHFSYPCSFMNFSVLFTHMHHDFDLYNTVAFSRVAVVLAFIVVQTATYFMWISAFSLRAFPFLHIGSPITCDWRKRRITKKS
jgi:hypothetical protein